VLGFKAGAPLCWTMGRETLPLQIAQALLKPTFFLCVFFGFLAHLFVCLFFGVHSCLSSPCLLVHLAIHWWLFVTHYHFVLYRHLATHLTLLTFVVALMNYSFHLVHHHLTIRHCLALSLPCVVYCHLMFLIVALCCLPLLCCHHHCIVITIITPLFVLPSINTTSTPHLIVAHSHIAICLTPYCGDGISCLLYFPLAFNVQVSTKATFTFQKVTFFFILIFWFCFCCIC
jgi:hypothetical protein